jgi:hypothetical protein
LVKIPAGKHQASGLWSEFRNVDGTLIDPIAALKAVNGWKLPRE